LARAAAILIENDQVAVIERHRADTEYFIFPGGQVEEGESPENTVIREIKEELGVDIIVRRQIAEVKFHGEPQYYFLAEIVGGQFGTGAGEEMHNLLSSESGTYTPIWMPISELLKQAARPIPISEMIGSSQRQGWPQEVLRFDESG